VLAKTELDELLDKVDKVYRSESSTSTMVMTIKTPHWERSLKMKSWTRGMEHTFITILSPRKEKGISTLKKENEMWNYFPKVNKVIKVPPSMMMGSWMGSDFTNDDLVKENTYREDYTYKILKKEKQIYTIELTPKPKTITVWGKLVLLVDASRFIPLRQDYYDEKGKLVREMVFSKVDKIGSLHFPKKMTLRTLNKPGHVTEIEYQEIKLNAKVKKSVFSMKNLQKRR
jgi:outer membrane lipoprotein-sorting protein